MASLCWGTWAEGAENDFPVAPAALEALHADAELVDVAFIDPRRGWAVGDRGVIWATNDGGKQWRLRPSGVDCRLESVHFIDAENGWAAGGQYHPYTHTSRGVLLRTRDGGRTWSQDKGLLLPALTRVEFFNPAQGWALGEPSALSPSGVSWTDNGGRTWSPLIRLWRTAVPGWSAGDFVEPMSGAIASRSGALVAVRGRAVEESPAPGFGLRGVRRLKLDGATPARRGWLVGDGGLVLVTGDLGRTWQAPAAYPAAAAGDQFDWRAVEVRGPKCWIAGSPGTRVLHTADAGHTWHAFSTGQNAPIHALTFVDDQHGWAVGALGTRLATSDGGRTWQRQQSGGTRAAIAAFFSDPESVPLELFARLSGNEGYLAVVHVLNRRDQEPGQARLATLPDRAHAALVGVGASGAETAWGFPLRQPGLGLAAERLVEGWNRVHDGAGVERLEAYVVRQIRCWRPDVVITHAASPRGDDPLGHIINQIVLGAVEQAADATCLPEQRVEMGLEPWQVTKVFGTLSAGQLGGVNVNTSQLAPRLGSSLADLATDPRGLIEDEYAAAPVAWGFQLLVDHLPQGLGEHDVMSGITLEPGGEARRTLTEGPAQGLDEMRRIAQKHRNVQAILSRTGQLEHEGARLLAEIDDLTAGLDKSGAGDVLFRLAEGYYRSGRWEMAAETFELLAARHPDHPLSPAALVWLVQYWSSGEAARRSGRPQPGSANTIGGLAHDTAAAADRPARAAAAARLLARVSPATFAEPWVRFPLAVAHLPAGRHGRHESLSRDGERFYLDLVRTRPHDAWWACAAGEQWLADRHPGAPGPPKGMAGACAAGTRPRLDGRLEDAVWRRAKPIELASALGDDGGWPAVGLMAYDDEFLYLAFSCRQAAGSAYEASTEPRPRDPDLAAHDRIDVFLDVDRDWATYYRLTVDHRGWTGDECWGDATWDPPWFVAAKTDADRWVVEAAVRWQELTFERPRAKDVWGLGVERTVPGVGFQSWSTPAATTVLPEGFGYLIFE